MAKRFTQVTVIILMDNGQQRMSVLPTMSKEHIGDAFREAIEYSSPKVVEAVIVCNDGIHKYTASEVVELAQHPDYQ